MLADRRRLVARLAWSVCLTCVGLALCALPLTFMNGRTLVAYFGERDGVVLVLVISFSVVGALIASHRPENLIGWIFCAAALFQALSAVGVEYGTYALVTRPGALPFGTSVSWLAEWIWAPGLGLILVFLPLLFPDGSPPSRRWRPVVWLGGLSIFRYRLYDIDRIVNRVLVYGALTVSLVLVYLGAVISLQYAFRTLAGGESQVAVVASTLAMAALFDPLRRRASRRWWTVGSTGASTTPERPLRPSRPGCATRRTWTHWAASS